MKKIQDLYEDIEPIKVQGHFVGGPFDGKITELTIKKKLDKTVFFVMRDKSIYRFKEPYVFEFDGHQAPPDPEPKPTLKQQVIGKIIKWALS